jgi:O-antigen/teichoic acid export membrane protein
MNLLPALMIPIYTYRVPPSVYGVLELLNRSQEILLLILSFGLRSALLTFYQMGNDDPERQKGIYSTALQFLSSFGLALILPMMLGARIWSKALFGTRAYSGAIVLILVATYFETVFQMAVLYLQSELRSVLYVSIFTTRALLAVALNLILVYWWRWGLTGILWATVLHTSAYAIAVVIFMFRHTGLRFDGKLLGEMLRFGAPVMIGAFGSFILNNGDRYFLNHYGTPADVGLYGLGYRVGVLSMSLVLMPFGKIWSVTMVNISKKPDGPFQLSNVATYLLFACTFATLGFSLLSPYLIRFFSERSYWNAYRIVPLIGAAYIFYSWTIVMDASFYLTKRTFYKIYSISIAGAVVMLLYWWLIPRFGMMGAAWATLGGYVSFAALTAFYAQRVYFIPYQLKRLSLLFFGALVSYEVGALIPITPVASGIIFRSLVTLAFPVALWLGGFLKDNERHALGEYGQILRLRYFGGAGV